MTKIPIHSSCYGLPSEKDRALRTEERLRFVLTGKRMRRNKATASDEKMVKKLIRETKRV
jgi:hypothetical protein